MKKNLLFVLIAFCSITAANAQNPVPNASFENWTAGNPNQWFTNNLGLGGNPITQTTPPYSGTLAVKGEAIAFGTFGFGPLLMSTDTNGVGFPVTQPYSTFSFYYKLNVTGNSAFTAVLGMTDALGGTTAAAGQNYTANVSSYTLASLPIFNVALNPTSCIITFLINDSTGIPPAVGNYFVVDDVLLSGSVGIDEPLQPLVFSIEKIQPNPANASSQVYYSMPEGGDVNFKLIDISGRMVKEILMTDETAGRHKMDFDVLEIPAGFYMLQMVSASKVHTKTLQVVH